MTDQDLWDLFILVAKPTQCFADCSHDNQDDVIQAMRAAYDKGVKNSNTNKINQDNDQYTTA